MLKKSMDIIDLYTWVNLNRESLGNCIVDNAYRSDYTWLLKLRCIGENKLLKIEPGERIHLSINEPPSKKIDPFTRYLRAHVRDSKITDIEIPWWERIVVLKTERRDRVLIHYVEIIPRGLWVIVDEAGKILYASRFEEFRDRVVKPGEAYRPPPLRGIDPSNTDLLIKSLYTSRDLVRGIVSTWGLPGYIAEELIYRSGLYSYKLTKPSEIQHSSLEQLIIEYRRLVEESRSGRGYMVFDDNGKIEFYSPYRPLLFIEQYGREIKEEEFNKVLDVYFNEYEAYLKSGEKKREIEEKYRAWKKRIEEHKKIIEEYRRELEDVKRVLGVIYENYMDILNIHECIREKREKTGWGALVDCGIRRYDQGRGVVYVEIGGLEIALTVYEDLGSQVVRLEKKKGELEKKIENAEKILQVLEAEGGLIEKELSTETYTKTSPKYWFEKYRWSITRNGFTVIAGRDASQNETLVRKHLGDRDIFLHADIHGAPATVLIRGLREPSLEDIYDAAIIAACYSKAWKMGFGYVEVYWVPGKQVSKSPPPGEYLGKGAFMVYGERNYLRIPLVIGIGLRLFCDQVYGDYVKLYTSSLENIKKNSISYVVISPGDMESREASKTIVKILRDKALEKTGVLFDIDENEIQRILPGSIRIIDFGIGEGQVDCGD